MSKAIRHLLFGIVALASILGNTSCGIHRVYGGRVIDAGTREPIEGAVVVAHWLEARATVAGESTRLEDVKETLTDKDGKWSITGPRGQEGCNPILLFTFLTGTHYTREPAFIVFKPGYCSFPQGFSIIECREKIKPAGTAGIMEGKNVELPKLKDRSRMIIIRNLPSLGIASEAEEKLPLIKRLIEAEEKEIRR